MTKEQRRVLKGLKRDLGLVRRPCMAIRAILWVVVFALVMVGIIGLFAVTEDLEGKNLWLFIASKAVAVIAMWASAKIAFWLDPELEKETV